MDSSVRHVLGILLCCNLVGLLFAVAFEDGNNNNVKIDQQSLELTQTINIQRQELMQRQCELMDGNKLTVDDLSELQMDHMIVDKEHKLLYCYVPKVGLSFRTYWFIQPGQNNFHKCQLKNLKLYDIFSWFFVSCLFLYPCCHVFALRASLSNLFLAKNKLVLFRLHVFSFMP